MFVQPIFSLGASTNLYRFVYLLSNFIDLSLFVLVFALFVNSCLLFRFIFFLYLLAATISNNMYQHSGLCARFSILICYLTFIVLYTFVTSTFPIDTWMDSINSRHTIDNVACDSFLARSKARPFSDT